MKKANYILAIAMAFSLTGCMARSWKKGSDRAGCIMNIRNVQQAIRSYQGMNDLSVGDTIPAGEIVGPGKFIELEPICPGGGTYKQDLTKEIVVPEVGKEFLKCSLCDTEEHKPQDTEGW